MLQAVTERNTNHNGGNMDFLARTGITAELTSNVKTPCTDFETVRKHFAEPVASFTLETEAGSCGYTVTRKEGRQGTPLRFVSATLRGKSRGVYIGTVFPSGDFSVTRGSKMSSREFPCVLFAGFWKAVQQNPELIRESLEDGSLKFYC
jgi:hypothetical protein